VTKGFLMDRLKFLEKYWKQTFQDHCYRLNYKDIDSTDYIKDNVFAKADLFPDEGSVN